MAALLLAIGFYILYPVLLLIVNSFNVARINEPFTFSTDNWIRAFQERGIMGAMGNTLIIFWASTIISFPLAIGIAWALARVRMPFSYGLEFLFWASFTLPTLATTIGWMFLADPDRGLINAVLGPVLGDFRFNIYSMEGIIWAHLMAHAISGKVMLLTPAFRNMDSSMEEASRVAGGSNFKTALRVTLPLMIPPMVVVFALQLVRMFDSFEIEQLLGVPVGIFVYSTKIFDLARSEPPEYGMATALASLTMLVIFLVIPIQRRILGSRQYTTVGSHFRPGLIDLGIWSKVFFGLIGFLLFLLILAPIFSLVLGSFMTRLGFFNARPPFSMRHWELVLSEPLFLTALKNTLILAGVTAVISPLIFSIIAYILVRTRWPGRGSLDGIIWMSAAIPGILSGLGLLWMFLGTAFLKPLYGTLWALGIVAVLQGKLTGVQIAKGVFLQMGQELEEASRVAGAGWVRTYFKIWVPLIMPTLVLLGTLHFVIVASTTSSIILLANRGTMTLSILALEFASPTVAMREEAGIVTLFIVGMTLTMAFFARSLAIRMGIRHR